MVNINLVETDLSQVALYDENLTGGKSMNDKFLRMRSKSGH